MALIVHPGEDASPQAIGGKAGALAALATAGLPVPPWCALTPDAFDVSLTDELHRALQVPSSTAEALAAALADLRPAPAVLAVLDATLAALCPAGEMVAVRSSAVEEDGAEHSFAGQLESYLFVPVEHVAERLADVWRSGYSERVLTYRREHGLSPLPTPPAVLIQRMVSADVSGVAFSADPVAGRRAVAVVSAVYGLGTSLVSGESDADTFSVDRDGQIVARRLAEKRTAHAYAPSDRGTVRPVPVPPDRAAAPALNDAQIRAVAELARRCEDFFGRPQDIEWAIEDGHLYLLQSRPITSLARLPDPDGVYALWDNSNIAESYAGVTTPLTFSFARHAYEEVYRQLCRLLGVPEDIIAEHADTFRHMIGLINGRVYYNLLSWYSLLALAPGFAANRRFMEQMMGVKEGLPERLVPTLAKLTWGARVRDNLRLLRAVGGLLSGYRRLPRDIEQFYIRIDAALTAGGPNLRRMRADELVAYYRRLEGQLLTRWDAPLVNDLFAMMFYGLSRRLTTAWCGDSAGSLQNDLLCGEGGIISAEPAVRVRAMALTAAPHPDLVAALCDGAPTEALAALERVPDLYGQYAAYLDKFADRCLEELKLESPTLRDDPLSLLRSIGHLARRLQSGAAPENVGAREADVRLAAEGRVRQALARRPLRRPLFAWVLENARARVRDRENLRFERTRVFGRVRAIFVELGRRLYALDLLAEPRDIFYLEVEEALGFVTGTATTTDLKGLVSTRKAAYTRYRMIEPPSERFETYGVVNAGNSFRGERRAEDLSGDRRTGTGACPGIVRGPVRVITDPNGAEIRPGEILVAERTDPGWIMLFPAAAGVLVERGSLLSHSAIVAREMGIPTVVALGGVTRWLRDGDWVEFDGSTGVVTKIAAPAEVPSHA
jgi:pyruvate,water dikinase